ncbi:hypothetical protein H072_8180 [Dactylellina haptotyla CBS 200.50]|uniref:polynucleotide adenylyltransferase n=1 Tax=Dactylellina haptotyla (strain CBS 200.50) TaxID=1284197 RepID=S8BFM0_DACHA|nr:hypothetical protein H072_8180 [Dactylellina haptotyla CBS 200.50]
MDNRTIPTPHRLGELGQVSDSAGPISVGQDSQVPLPSSRTLAPSQGPNLESQLRGMLMHGSPANLEADLRPHKPPKPDRLREAPMPIISPHLPQNQFPPVTTSPTRTRFLPSPNMPHQNFHQQPPATLQRSSTLPTQSFAPRPGQTPGLDKSSSYAEGISTNQYSPHHSYQNQRPQTGRYEHRQTRFQHAPIPQINNALHFPPLGTVPTQQQQQQPLSERHAQGNMNNYRRQSGPGHYQQDKHFNNSYNHGDQYHRYQGQNHNQGYSPPQNRRSRGHHAYRGSHGGRGNRNFLPLEYTAITEYATSIIDNVRPPPEEIKMKDRMLQRISDICKKLVPGSHIIPFGSLVSGFATRGADMDVIFAHETLDPQPSSMESNIPVRLANEFLKRGFEVDLLIRTRVPILKIKTPSHEIKFQPSSPSTEEPLKEAIQEDPWPENISCDIGFKNHLGITNSHFLRTYSQYDKRFSEMVLFIKQWSKNRDLNSPYFGTLSSYGYVLMVAHFLINVVQPPVLPNLQLIAPPHDTPTSELMQEGYNIWYFKDISRISSGELLPSGKNGMSLGQLIYEFFQYYTTNFNFVSEVVTIRTPGGVMYKQEKGWTSARERVGEMTTYQDRYLLAIEDPFEISHNVGRTCGGQGVRRIRGEMQRAAAIIRKISTQVPLEATTRQAGWEMQVSIDDLMVTVRQNNRGFRNRKNNQKNLVEWIKHDWAVGQCLTQIETATEEARKRRELGLPDDAELPPESEESSDDPDSDEEEENDETSDSDDSTPRLVVRSEPSHGRIIEGLIDLKIS